MFQHYSPFYKSESEETANGHPPSCPIRPSCSPKPPNLTSPPKPSCPPPSYTGASVMLGPTITGAPGTNASVTNAGTAQHAVLHFTIPSGMPATALVPDTLTATNTAPQMTTAGGAVSFSGNPTDTGASITHVANASEVDIVHTGVYHIAFHCIGRHSGPSAAVTRTLSLYANHEPVSGASAQHSFVLGAESATISFSTILTVTTLPARLQVVADGDEISLSSVSISVYRLGAAPQP